LATGEPIQFVLQRLNLFADRNRPFELEHRQLSQWIICHLIPKVCLMALTVTALEALAWILGALT
jgi:hypothetical protein